MSITTTYNHNRRTEHRQRTSSVRHALQRTARRRASAVVATSVYTRGRFANTLSDSGIRLPPPARLAPCGKAPPPPPDKRAGGLKPPRG